MDKKRTAGTRAGQGKRDEEPNAQMQPSAGDLEMSALARSSTARHEEERRQRIRQTECQQTDGGGLTQDEWQASYQDGREEEFVQHVADLEPPVCLRPGTDKSGECNCVRATGHNTASKSRH